MCFDHDIPILNESGGIFSPHYEGTSLDVARDMAARAVEAYGIRACVHDESYGSEHGVLVEKYVAPSNCVKGKTDTPE